MPPNSLMQMAPSQKVSGPEPATGNPDMLGHSQSCHPCCAMVHMTPKSAASAFFHGSRPISPGRIYSRHSNRMPQRGKASVADADRRTGLGEGIRLGCVSDMCFVLVLIQPTGFLEKKAAEAAFFARKKLAGNFGTDVAEFLAEFFNATSGIDDFVFTGVERMRFS